MVTSPLVAPDPQVLSAVPRSHVGVSGHRGFAKLGAAEAAVASTQREKLQVQPCSRARPTQMRSLTTA